MEILESLYSYNNGVRTRYDIAKLNNNEVAAHDSELMYLEERAFGSCDDKSYSDRIQDGECDSVLVALVNDGGKRRIVGYINGKHSASEKHYISSSAVQIDNLVVDENHRRKGIARKLMNNMLKIQAKPYSFLELYVYNINVTAEELYTKLGFKCFDLWKNNQSFYRMFYQADPRFSTLGGIIAASLKQLGNNPLQKDVFAWFDKVYQNKGLMSNESFVNTKQIVELCKPENNELFRLSSFVVVDYYIEKEKQIAKMIEAGVEKPHYPFERYVSDRTIDYYNNATCNNTINYIARDNDIYNVHSNMAAESIHMLKCAMICMRDAAFRKESDSIAFSEHNLTKQDIENKRAVLVNEDIML